MAVGVVGKREVGRKVAVGASPTRQGFDRLEYQRIKLFTKRRAGIVYLGGRCELCGVHDDGYADGYVFQFDHIDWRTKPKRPNNRGVLSYLRNATPHKFWDMIERCQLLCVECHIDKSALEWSVRMHEEYSSPPPPF